MKLRFKYNCSRWFMFRARAHVIFYPFILFRDSREEVSDVLFRHELEHVYTIRRLGWFGFFSDYLRELLTVGYKNNFYEALANAAENTPLTAHEQWLRKQ